MTTKKPIWPRGIGKREYLALIWRLTDAQRAELESRLTAPLGRQEFLKLLEEVKHN